MTNVYAFVLPSNQHMDSWMLGAYYHITSISAPGKYVHISRSLISNLLDTVTMLPDD